MQEGNGLREQRSFSAREQKHAVCFNPLFPRSSPGNFTGYHGNRWIPGTTLLLPTESPSFPPSPPSSSSSPLRLSLKAPTCTRETWTDDVFFRSNTFHFTSGKLMWKFGNLQRKNKKIHFHPHPAPPSADNFVFVKLMLHWEKKKCRLI